MLDNISSFSKIFAFTIVCIFLSAQIHAAEYLEKYKQTETMKASLDPKTLYGEKLQAVILETLKDATAYKVFDEAIHTWELSAESKDIIAAHYYTVASILRDIVREDNNIPEKEKQIALQRSIHYFMRSLFTGDRFAFFSLGYECSKIKPLLNELKTNNFQTTEPIIKLLEKTIHDYWVFDSKKAARKPKSKNGFKVPELPPKKQKTNNKH